MLCRTKGPQRWCQSLPRQWIFHCGNKTRKSSRLALKWRLGKNSFDTWVSNKIHFTGFMTWWSRAGFQENTRKVFKSRAVRVRFSIVLTTSQVGLSLHKTWKTQIFFLFPLWNKIIFVSQRVSTILFIKSLIMEKPVKTRETNKSARKKTSSVNDNNQNYETN